MAIAVRFSFVKGELAGWELRRGRVFCHCTLRRLKYHLQRAGLEKPLVNLRHRPPTLIGWLSFIYTCFLSVTLTPHHFTE